MYVLWINSVTSLPTLVGPFTSKEEGDAWAETQTVPLQPEEDYSILYVYGTDEWPTA